MEGNLLNLETFLHLGLPLKEAVQGIERLCVNVPLPTVSADYRFNIFHQVEFSMEPMGFRTFLFTVLPSQNLKVMCFLL